MTAGNNTWTTTGNLAAACIRRGRIYPGAKIVVVVSDNISVQDWLYRYLELYEAKGYVFWLMQTEADFSEYAGKADTVMAFVEDIFFGERTVGKLDYYRKKFPKLRLTVFSASNLPVREAARYVSWSKGSYLSLRGNEKEIRESVEAVFGKQQAVPLYLKNSITGYGRLPDIEPHLTHREIEIIRCAMEGKTAKQTASVLMLSQRTVQNHIANIYRKFGIRNMVGVLKLAMARGILPVEELMAYTVNRLSTKPGDNIQNYQSVDSAIYDYFVSSVS